MAYLEHQTDEHEIALCVQVEMRKHCERRCNECCLSWCAQQIAAGSMTVCAIGPAPAEAIDAVTSRLKLL